MPSYRIHAINPQSKKVARSFSPYGYTPAQLKKIETDFKIWVRLGKDYKSFPIPEWYTLNEPNNQNIEKTLEKKSHFETMHIKDLDLPENGAMSFCCIGSTRSGKSYAINYIYENIFKKHITLLMTLSSHADIYKGFRKNAVIYDGFKSQLIEEPMKINKETKNHYNFCLIFDDLVMDGKNDRSMTKLLTIGRNCGMSAVISGQKLSMLSATGRSNINYVLCFKQNSEMAIEDTIKTFLRSYMPKDIKMNEMIRLYKELTDDHHFFLIDTLNDKCYISKI